MRALNKLRQRLNKARGLAGAKRRLDQYASRRTKAEPVFLIDTDPFYQSFLGIFSSNVINVARLFQRAEAARNIEYNRWVRARLRQDEQGFRFVGEGFSVWFPEHFGNESITAFVNDLREIVLQNVYSHGFPFGRLVSDGAVVFDCGANIGSFSTWVASTFPDTQVLAFEPEPLMYRTLCENVERNGLSERVRGFAKALGSQEGEVELLCDDACATQHKLVTTYDASVQEDQRRRAKRINKVPCVTIDRVVEEMGIERCDLIKMDIEGAEPEALRGAKRTIERFRPRLSLASYHRPSDTYALPMMVKEMCADYNILVLKTHLYAFT